VLKYYVFDNFVTINVTAIVTFDFENVLYRCTKNWIELVSQKHAFLVFVECKVNFKRNIREKTQRI
jgi:hypothetical protein